MSSISPQDWYRKKIRDLFEERKSMRGSYSLRAFARDCKVSPSLISEIITGRHPLTPHTADKIASRFLQNSLDRELLKSAARASIKKAYRQTFEKLLVDTQTEVIDSRNFDPIAHWSQLAILELGRIKDLKLNTRSVSQLLKITLRESRKALRNLVKNHQLIRKNGSYSIKTFATRVRSKSSSSSIRKFHTDILKKALLSIYDQSLEERDLGSAILAFNTERIQEAKSAIEEFRKDFLRRFCTEQADSVYVLNTQFFNLTQKGPSHEN